MSDSKSNVTPICVETHGDTVFIYFGLKFEVVVADKKFARLSRMKDKSKFIEQFQYLFESEIKHYRSTPRDLFSFY